MPFVSDHALSRFAHTHHRALSHMKEQKENIRGAAECVLGAGGVGFLRGKMEDASGAWNVPGTDLDIEMVAGAAGVAVSIFAPKTVGKYSDDLLEVSKGVLAHYAGQVGRKFGKTGKFSMIAGGDADIIGTGALNSALGL